MGIPGLGGPIPIMCGRPIGGPIRGPGTAAGGIGKPLSSAMRRA